MYLLLALDFWEDFSASSYVNINRMEGAGWGPSAMLEAKHIPESVRWREVSSQESIFSFENQEDNKNGNFLIHIHCNSYFFFLTWLFIVRGFQTMGSPLEINRKIVFSVGMEVNWSTGEVKLSFPCIPKVTGPETERMVSWTLRYETYSPTW